MGNKGVALMGVGHGSGEHKTLDAAQQAINSPLLDEVSISGATSVLINVTGNSDLTMFELNEASTLIQEEAHEDVNVIWGWVIDETMQDEACVTVIATGFDNSYLQATPSIESRARSAANGSRRNGRSTTLSNPPALVSGLNPDDYDIPTFFRNTD
jgi:cell division protein FtsZ